MKKYIIISFLCTAAISLCSQSLSLDSCLNLALENNRRIKEAKLECNEAKAVKKNLATKYFPKVMGGGAIMKADDYLLKGEIPEANLPVYDGNPANLQTATQFAYFPGMEMQLLDYANIGYMAAIQPVYMGGKIRYGNKLAKKGIEMRENNLLLTQEEVAFETENQFWTLISLKEKMKTIESYEKLLDKLRDEVSVAYEAGLVLKTDLLKVELKINELIGNKLQLENGIEMMTFMICHNIGIKYNENIEFEYKDLAIKDPVQMIHKPDTSLTSRQEYLMLKRLVEVEQLQKRVTRSDFLPQFSVGVQGLYMDALDNQTTNIIGFATLNIPLSDWWGGAYEIKEQKIKIQIAENNLAHKSELMKLEIINANNELNESRKQIMIADKSVTQANEHFKVIRDNYEAGLVNTSDMLEAQAMLTETQNNLTDALCTNKIKLASYKKCIGSIIQ